MPAPKDYPRHAEPVTPRFPGLDWTALCVTADTPIFEAFGKLEKTGKGILLVIDAQDRLRDVLFDGDIRQWIVEGKTIVGTVRQWLTDRCHPAKVVSARAGTDSATLLKIMREHEIDCLPLLDDRDHVTGVVTLDELQAEALSVRAVIMAGGFGTRLRPLTIDIPKPMLPVGGKPLMELIVRHLRANGIRKVSVSTFYKAEKIREHFGNGERFGVEVNYVFEDQPLGTVGALSLLEPTADQLLVMNGDILTSVNIRSLSAYHRREKALLTVGVRTHHYKVPYGVIHNTGAKVTRIVEKPTMSYFVNAGIYLLEPAALEYIPTGRRFDMTDLIDRLLTENHTVACFPILEYWLDIGQHGDYEQAQEDIKTGRFAA